MLQLFAGPEEITRLNNQLAEAAVGASLPLGMAKAWYLRQQDTKLALKLADEVEDGLKQSSSAAGIHAAFSARVKLIRAEAMLLSGDLALAEQMVLETYAAFKALNDPAGMGDTEWLAASVWQEGGDQLRCVQTLASAHAHFAEAGDHDRVDAAAARSLWNAAFQSPLDARAQLAARFGRGSHRNPLVSTWIEASRAIITDFAGDFVESAGYFLRAYDAALQSGQYRVAITMVTNAGDKFAMLNSLAAALECDEKGLALARPTGWPSSIGVSLMQTGNALRLLGRFDEAQSLLCEAVDVLARFGSNRNYAILLGYLAELMLAIGDYKAAFDWFKQSENCLSNLRQPDMLIGSWHGQARALSGLGRPIEALAKAEASLQAAQDTQNVEGQVTAMRVLADIHRRHALAKPQAVEAVDVPLHYLQAALRLCATVPGYAVPDELLRELAAEYAASGQYQLAYETSLAASDARERKFCVDAHSRAIAMQISLDAA